MIRIEALSARPSSKGKSGLSKLDFSIPARKVVGLIGPIGAGKGGLLKVLAGGQKAKEGRF